MASPEDPEAVRRSLGLKPRSRPEADAAPGDASPEAATGTAPSPRETVKPSGLGIKRRSGPDAGHDERGLASQTEDDPRKKPTGKLPPRTQVLLRNYYVSHPSIDIPGYLQDLEGTHGWTIGDGRKGREIVLGFTPTFVLFTLPPDPDALADPRKSRKPGLHAQPELTEKGFKLPDHMNGVGDSALFIAWKAPETERKPGAAGTKPPAENPRDARRRQAQEKADAARRARDERRRKPT